MEDLFTFVCRLRVRFFLNLRLYLRDDFRLGLWTDRKAAYRGLFVYSFVRRIGIRCLLIHGDMPRMR